MPFYGRVLPLTAYARVGALRGGARSEHGSTRTPRLARRARRRAVREVRLVVTRQTPSDGPASRRSTTCSRTRAGRGGRTEIESYIVNPGQACA